MKNNLAHAENSMVQHLRSIAQRGEHYFWHDHRYQLVQWALPSHVQTLLDFGCGDGGFLRQMAVQRPTVQLHGYDSNVDAATFANNLMSAKPAIQVLPQWPPSNLRFDAITMLDVLEHIKDDTKALETIRDHIAPGGSIIITVPAMQLFWSTWDSKLGHYRRYSATSLQAVLAAAGFQTDYLSYFFSYLTPLALWRRFTCGHHRMKDKGVAEFPPISAATNYLLRSCGTLERKLLAFHSLPIGTSLIAVAHPGERT